MEINSVSLIYFSPTNGTKKMVKQVSQAFGDVEVFEIDLSLEDNRNKVINIKSDLVIVGVPVYAGRVPKIINESLKNIRGNGRPSILVTTYGNMSERKALFELAYILNEANLIAVGAGSFVCEHSFSTKENPISQSRPNEDDYKYAFLLGDRVRNKLNRNLSFYEMRIKSESFKKINPIDLGVKDYIGAKLFTKEPKVDIKKCTKCMVCAMICPSSAIDENLKIDSDKCIRCFACVKYCKYEARQKEFRVSTIKNILIKKDKEKHLPVLYL